MDWEIIETGVWWSFGNMYYDQEEPCFYCTFEDVQELYGDYCEYCGREYET